MPLHQAELPLDRVEPEEHDHDKDRVRKIPDLV